MIKAALYAAMACGLLSALTGNRTAWALLASAAFCLTLDRMGIAFHFVYWMLVDFVVVLFIIRPKMTHADCVILALFIPAWISYLLPDPHRYTGAGLAVICQLLLTLPFHKAQAVPARLRAWWGKDDIFDRMVAHARLAGA